MPRLRTELRGQTIGLLQAGTSTRQVARMMRCAPSTISRLWQKFNQTGREEFMFLEITKNDGIMEKLMFFFHVIAGNYSLNGKLSVMKYDNDCKAVNKHCDITSRGFDGKLLKLKFSKSFRRSKQLFIFICPKKFRAYHVIPNRLDK